MQRTFDFATSLKLGAEGVAIIAEYLTKRGIKVTDFTNDKTQQMRGIDLYAEGYGYLEVKTDTHSSRHVWLEIDVSGKPGGIFRSRADYLVVHYVKEKKAVVYRLPEVQQWLMHNYYGLYLAGGLKAVFSERGTKKWYSTGVAVARIPFENDLTYAKEWKLHD